MKLTMIQIENFRSFEDETIHFDDYTCFVGPNGSGKSVVLTALNVFFQENVSTSTDVSTLSEEDFHHKNTKKPIKITVTFEGLSEAAQQEFSHYCRQGKLVIFAQAKWDEASNSAIVKHFGSRLVMKEFSAFFEAEKEGKKVPELREIYQKITKNIDSIPNAPTKAAMRDALREYEEEHPGKCVFMDEPNQFYGFSKGGYHLEKYIQWVYVPAVKDASTEQDEGKNTALGQLLSRTVRTKLDFSDEINELRMEIAGKYEDILEKQKKALSGLAGSMEERLKDYVDPRAKLELKWHYDAKKTISVHDPAARALIGDGDFIGEVARSGHGMQRGFLVTILHELAGNEAADSPKLLLGIEEPELYQHPPQAQHLAEVLERLALPENNAQVVITTHSPYFVSSNGFENIRMVKKIRNNRLSKVSHMTYEKLQERLNMVLPDNSQSVNSLIATVGQIMHPSQNELFFSGVAVLVEGIEDVAYISTQLGLSGKLNDFRRFGCHFVVAGGKNKMSRLVAIASELKIPFYVIFDADGNSNENDRENHKRDNKCLMELCSGRCDNPFPAEIFCAGNMTVWPINIKKTICQEFGDGVWNNAQNCVREKHGLIKVEGVNNKNAILIAYTLEHLFEKSQKSQSLIKLIESILKYSEIIHRW